jgi:PAT family acetyl-CoA transporter-like MFS transporter 1
VKATECTSDHGKAVCADLGGECVTERDGYYIMSAVCVALGVAILLMYIRPTAKRLQSKSGLKRIF